MYETAIKGHAEDILRQFLAEEHPQQLFELEIVFDDLFETITSAHPGPGPESSNEGSPLIGAAATGAVVASATWIVISFLKAVAKDYVKHELPQRFDAIEAKLAKATKKPELVSKLRRRVERILGSF